MNVEMMVAARNSRRHSHTMWHPRNPPRLTLCPCGKGVTCRCAAR